MRSIIIRMKHVLRLYRANYAILVYERIILYRVSVSLPSYMKGGRRTMR